MYYLYMATSKPVELTPSFVTSISEILTGVEQCYCFLTECCLNLLLRCFFAPSATLQVLEEFVMYVLPRPRGNRSTDFI